jgi:RNA polymerase sigma factor (sigma-70 family)
VFAAGIILELRESSGNTLPACGGWGRFVGGEEQSRFSNLVLPYLADCFALARWVTGNAADAEDVVQEACLRAYRGINGYAGGNARAWVLAIVRNTAYSWLRKNRPAEIIAVDDLESVESTGMASFASAQCATTPETALLAKADATRLQDAIMALPAEFREALILREVHGLDYREIATVIGTPVGTVMSRLARARRRLLANLEKDTA